MLESSREPQGRTTALLLEANKMGVQFLFDLGYRRRYNPWRNRIFAFEVGLSPMFGRKHFNGLPPKLVKPPC